MSGIASRFYGVGIKPAPNDQYWNLSCYLNEYLRNHPRIRKDMTLMVANWLQVIMVYRSRSMRLPTRGVAGI